jgi:hypothetical protein
MYVSYWSWQYFRVKSQTVRIYLLGKSIQEASLYIAKGTRVDEATISVSAASQTQGSGDRGFGIWISDDFRQKSLYCQGVTESSPITREGMRWYWFGVQSERPSCTLVISGQILTMSVRELDLSLNVVATDQPPTFPLTVQIANMNQVDVTDLSPVPPSFRSSYIIQYLPLSSEGNNFAPISMQIKDRELSARTEFKTFWAGIFFGVFSSFVASIAYDLARYWERRLKPKKVPPIILP